jgi:hypothetical protein
MFSFFPCSCSFVQIRVGIGRPTTRVPITSTLSSLSSMLVSDEARFVLVPSPTNTNTSCHHPLRSPYADERNTMCIASIPFCSALMCDVVNMCLRRSLRFVVVPPYTCGGQSRSACHVLWCMLPVACLRVPCRMLVSFHC